MRDVLLVGGTHDGETIAITDRAPLAIRLVCEPSPSISDAECVGLALPLETYQLARLLLFGRMVTVGMGQGTTPEAAIPALLSGPALALWEKSRG